MNEITKSPKDAYDKMINDMIIDINMGIYQLFEKDSIDMAAKITEFDREFRKRIPKNQWMGIFSIYNYSHTSLSFTSSSTINTEDVNFVVVLRYKSEIIYINIREKDTMINIFSPVFQESIILKNYKKELADKLLNEIRYTIELNEL